MRTRKLVKRFVFEEKNRGLVTFGSSDIRLNPQVNMIHLKKDDVDGYPTDADIYVKTWVSNIGSLKGFLLFESVIHHQFSDDGSQITGDGYRLGDGTDQYWWNGAAWVVDSSNWNTEQEVCENIASFPVITQNIQVIINLSTTDSKYTPFLEMIKILYSSDIEFQEDIIYGSLVKDLKENIRPITDYPVKISEDASTIDLLNDFPLKTPYNIAGIDSVFNHTLDEKHLVDIFQSWNPTTKVITLNQTLTADTVVWIRFTYEPEVAVTTNRQYTEIGKVPCIVVADVRTYDTGEGNVDETVINKATGNGTRVKAPKHKSIEFVLRCLTDKARDQTRLTDAVSEYFRQNPLIRSRGMDLRYSVISDGGFDQQDPVGQSEINVERLRLRITNALFYNRGDQDAVAVSRFVVGGSLNLVVS